MKKPLCPLRTERFCCVYIPFVFKAYTSNLLSYDGILISLPVMRTIVGRIAHKPVHLVLVKVNHAGIAVIFLIIGIVHTVFTIRFASHCAFPPRSVSESDIVSIFCGGIVIFNDEYF
jgi:hypothetical protein